MTQLKTPVDNTTIQNSLEELQDRNNIKKYVHKMAQKSLYIKDKTGNTRFQVTFVSLCTLFESWNQLLTEENERS